MKYNVSSVQPKSWLSEYLIRTRGTIQEKIIDTIWKDKSYVLNKLNVLKNNGVIEEDQKPYYDYKP